MAARITGVATRVVSLPLREPIRTSIHDSREIVHVLVRVHTESGGAGIGHCFAFRESQARVLEAMVADLGARLRGLDAGDVQTVWDRLWRENGWFGRRGVSLMAASALDTACWDLKARGEGAPLWAVLGGRGRPLPCYASDSLWLGDPVERLPELARERAAAGYGAMKVRVGSLDAGENERRVAAVREAIGEGITLMADANQGWTREQAVALGAPLRAYGLHWLEEPVAAEDVAGLAVVAAGTGIPIASGESWYGMLDVAPALAAGGLAVLMPDLQRIGGVTGFLAAARAARDNGVRVSPHLFPEISVHLMCALPDDDLIEYVPWFAELYEDCPAPAGGALAPSDRPGLGLAFKSELFPPDR